MAGGGTDAERVDGGAGAGLDAVILPICFSSTNLSASLEMRGNWITMKQQGV